MDFSFSEEQRLLQDSIQKFVTNDYEFETRRNIVEGDLGYSADNWKLFADQGWTMIPFSEEDGGIGGGPIEVMLLMEEFGKGLVVEPFIPTVIATGGFLRDGGSAAQKEKYLAGIIDGSIQGAFAFAEPQGRFNLANLSTTAKADGEGFVLNGHKAVVLNGPTADVIVVTARTSGEQLDETGISVFLVDANAEGVARRDYPTIDGLQASEITFENVKLTADALVGEKDAGLSLIQGVVDNSILAICAEAVGAMEVMYKTTVEYCKTREQFGQPIGKFQVLQHRMVDMFMEYEQSKSLLYMAAMKLEEGGAEATKAVSALKVQIGKGGKYVGQQAIQLHGGMGMTDELAVGHYFKRITMIDTMFGNSDHHLKRFAALSQ